MSNAYFPHLFSLLNVGKQIYKNRVISSPRGGIWNEEPDNPNVDPEQLSDVDQRAGGGVAVYTVGETAVSAAGGRGANEFYGFQDFSDFHTLRYRQYADRIHLNGAKALIELNHVGQAKSEINEGEQAYGPIDVINEDGIAVHAMTEEDITQVCRDFGDAAFFCQKAGFDGVCVH
jgi:2,4-dienoyl-CoA reductase-like NADH-dependent reductase (Old Yellow Enzyme family)